MKYQSLFTETDEVHKNKMNYLERLFTETVDTHFDKGSVRVSVTHCKYDTVYNVTGYNVTLIHPHGFQQVSKIPMELTYNRLQQKILDDVLWFKQRVDRIKPNPNLEDTIKEILSESEPYNIVDNEARGLTELTINGMPFVIRPDLAASATKTEIINYAQGVCDGTFGVGKATVELHQANYVAKYTTAIGHTNCVVLNVIAGEPIDDFRRRFRAALDDSLKAYQEIMSRPADDPFTLST